MKTRILTEEEEKEILKWSNAHPRGNLDLKIKEWRAKYNCSEFSIIQVFVKEGLGKIKVDN